MRIPRFVPILVVILGTAALPAAPQQQKAILDYKLSMPLADKILASLPAVTQYVVSLPDAKAQMARAAKQSFEERIKTAEDSPKFVELLKKYGLTPREYMVGVVALRMALLAADNAAGSPLPGNIVASPDNVAFARAHLGELKPKMDAADGLTTGPGK